MTCSTLHATVARTLSAAVFFAICGSASAVTPAYPTKPITLIVPVGAGGSIDGIARLFAQAVTKELGAGTNIVIENKPGANLQIGEQAAAQSTPDGHTLVITAAGHSINPALYPKMNYSPLKDLTGVFFVGKTELVLIASKSAPPNNVQEMIDFGKTQPNGIVFASSGAGGMAHLVSEMFVRDAGIKMMHVPYNGIAAALPDLISGRVSFLVDTVLTQLPLIQSGKVKVIATTNAERIASLPDTPTISESGIPNFEANSWMAVLAPSATPPEILEKIHSAFVAAGKTAEVQQALKRFGVIPVAMSRDQINEFIGSEAVRWKKVVDDANITLQ